jgi:hypothetical protein
MAQTRAPSPKTARYIKTLASEGLQHPSKLTAARVRESAASVMAHIEPRANNKTVCEPMPPAKADRRYKNMR